jgi:hypothetical protein
MTTWIVTNGTLWKQTPELRRGEIRGWLGLNGVNANLVPADSEVIIRENSDGIWVIDFEEYRTNAEGHVLLDPENPAEAYVQARTVPMDMDPPLYLLTAVQGNEHDN